MLYNIIVKLKKEGMIEMFNSYDRYLDYLDEQSKEWHKENDDAIESKIEELEYLIEDLKLCRTNEEVEQTFKDYKKEMEYEPDEDVNYTIENEIEELERQISVLKEELES